MVYIISDATVLRALLRWIGLVGSLCWVLYNVQNSVVVLVQVTGLVPQKLVDEYLAVKNYSELEKFVGR